MRRLRGLETALEAAAEAEAEPEAEPAAGAEVRTAEGALPAVVIGTVHWGAPTLKTRR
jgi:hypothetical protein